MTDLPLALSIAALIAVIFLAAIVARRQRPDPGNVMTGRGPLHHVEDRLSAVEKRMDASERHLGNIRAMIGALPSKDVVHRMDLQLTATAGKVEQVDAAVTSVGRAVDRIETYLLNQKNGPQ